MNNDYVGEDKGRCSNFGFDKNEVNEHVFCARVEFLELHHVLHV